MVDCQLFINNQRVADTAAALDSTLTALDDLHITWGRSDPLEQPAPAELAAVLDLPRSSALPEFIPGDLVEVHASGASARRKVTIKRDWQFYEASSAYVGGTRSALTLTPQRSGLFSVIQYPASPKPAQSDPRAWDGEITADPRTTVDISCEVNLPANCTVKLIPIFYISPYKSAYTRGEVVAAAATQGRHNLKVSLVSPARLTYPAIRLDITYQDESWNQAAGTWRSHNESWNHRESITVYNSTISGYVTAETSHVTVFTGRLSQITVRNSLPNPRIEICAVDFSADLDAIYIGDKPWPKETVAKRINRIKDLAAFSQNLILPTALNSIEIQERDVDRQSTLELLRSVARSTGSILWQAHHPAAGSYLAFENPHERPPLYRLQKRAGGVEKVVTSAADNFIRISAHQLDSEIEFVKTFANAASVCDVIYKIKQGDEVTEKTHTVVDMQALNRIGTRRIRIDTELTNPTDAEALGRRVLARIAGDGWSFNTLTWNTSEADADEADILKIVDSSRRIGRGIILTDLPAWLPGENLPMYIDGGEISFTNGAWIIAPQLTRPNLAEANTTWRQVPYDWTWSNVNALTWNDLAISTL